MRDARGRGPFVASWALLGVGCLVASAVVGCGYEDRSGDPAGDWERIADFRGSAVEFEAWETPSDREEYTCLSLSLTPDPIPEVPGADEPELYKGRKAVCDLVPSSAEPIQLLRISSGHRYGVLLLALPDGTTASLALDDGTAVQNAVTEDASSNVNLFVGLYAAARSPATVELTDSHGTRTCRFEKGDHAPQFACEDVT